MDSAMESVLPIYVIGDSHVLPYKNLLYREKFTRKLLLAKIKYIPGLTANDFYNIETQEFHPEVYCFLESEGLIRKGHATHLSQDEVDFSIFKASAQPVVAPLLLFALGEIDVRGPLVHLVRDGYDFCPPFETAQPLLDIPLVPWDILDEVIRQRIAPLIAGLQQLRECGFSRTYVQNVVPPTRNEARIKELSGYGCPLSVRTKLVMAFNRHLKEECDRLGHTRGGAITYLDLGNKLLDGGYLRPELEVDGVHLPPSAVSWYLEQLVEHALNHQQYATNHVRHALFYRMACGEQVFRSNAVISTST